MGARVYANVPEACAQTVKIVDTVQPVPENRRAYDAYYPVYRSLYPALKPAFDAVAEVE